MCQDIDFLSNNFEFNMAFKCSRIVQLFGDTSERKNKQRQNSRIGTLSFETSQHRF